MTGRAHPTWAELLQRLADPVAESPDLDAHMEACPECRARLDLARRALEALPEALDPGAPDTWRARAERRAVPRGLLAPLRGGHEASVVFDSATERRAGVRAGFEGGRQWLLATGPFELEIRLGDPLEASPYPLSGQLYPVAEAEPAAGPFRVRLDVEGETRGEASSEASGEFLLRERPEGPFRLVLAGDGWEVATPVLEP